MKQELFKEIYNNIHLDSKQKERILNCLEKENHKIQAKPQKRFHIPAITGLHKHLLYLIPMKPNLQKNRKIYILNMEI